MARSPEFSHPNPEVLHLGEKRFPFLNDFVVEKRVGQRGTIYEATLPLALPFETEELILPITISLQKEDSYSLGIVGLHRSLGYHIDHRDEDYDQRVKKLKAKKSKTSDKRFPLAIKASLDTEELWNRGFVKTIEHEVSDEYSISGNDALLVQALRFVVSVEGTFMSRGVDFGFGEQLEDITTELDMSGNDFEFEDFYPIESRPLPHDPRMSGTYYDPINNELSVGEGHRIFFAENYRERARIGMAFIIDPHFTHLLREGLHAA